MWNFKMLYKPHLKHATIYQWIRSLPGGSLTYGSPEEVDTRFEQLRELWEHLWQQHLRTLAPSIRERCQQGTWFSQRHTYAENAEPYLHQFRQEYGQLEYIKDIELGCYHADLVIIAVTLRSGTSDGAWLHALPQFY